MCGSMADIQSATAEIRRGKKEERRRNHRTKIYWPSLLRRAAIKKPQWQNISPSAFDARRANKDAQLSVTDCVMFQCNRQHEAKRDFIYCIVAKPRMRCAGSKLSAIYAQAVYFLHSTRFSVT